jgi:DNA-binding PadR family transcriptional regulator
VGFASNGANPFLSDFLKSFNVLLLLFNFMSIIITDISINIIDMIEGARGTVLVAFLIKVNHKWTMRTVPLVLLVLKLRRNEMRRRRGFVQFAILQLLKEGSMHGYQIMKELEERSNGAYSASAGTVYPALQELLDQNLIELNSESDKKIYFLNENGKKRLEETADRVEGDFWAEWKERMMWKNSEESVQLRAAVDRWEKEFRKAMKQTRGNPESVLQLITFIDEMTDRLKDQGDGSSGRH